jgi:hypothetical protein
VDHLENMKKVLNYLNGKKTHLTLLMAALIVVAGHYGMLSPEEYSLLIKLDALLIGGAVRDALKKLE